MKDASLPRTIPILGLSGPTLLSKIARARRYSRSASAWPVGLGQQSSEGVEAPGCQRLALAPSGGSATGASLARLTVKLPVSVIKTGRGSQPVFGSEASEKHCPEIRNHKFEIRLPPAESQQTFGSARDFRGQQEAVTPRAAPSSLLDQR